MESDMDQLSIDVNEFRRNIGEFLQQVKAGKVIQLMYRGSEIAKVVPPDFAQLAARQALDSLKETAEVGDVLLPIEESWSAQNDTGC